MAIIVNNQVDTTIYYVEIDRVHTRDVLCKKRRRDINPAASSSRQPFFKEPCPTRAEQRDDYRYSSFSSVDFS